MPRPMTSAMSTAVQGQMGKFCHLVYLGFANKTTLATEARRLTTSDADISADVGDDFGVQNWTAYGGEIEFDPVPESGDLKSAGVTITFPGVDVTLIADALNKYYFGRSVAIYRAHFSGSSVIATPICLFSGEMSGGADIDDTRGDDGGKVTIKLRAVSDMARLDEVRGLQTNIHSYRSLFPEYASDKFFDVVPSNARKQEPWGKKALED